MSTFLGTKYFYYIQLYLVLKRPPTEIWVKNAFTKLNSESLWQCTKDLHMDVSCDFCMVMLWHFIHLKYQCDYLHLLWKCCSFHPNQSIDQLHTAIFARQSGNTFWFNYSMFSKCQQFDGGWISCPDSTDLSKLNRH